MAAAVDDPAEKADFLKVEEGWLALARHYERERESGGQPKSEPRWRERGGQARRCRCR
jgi:hypothetical protein